MERTMIIKALECCRYGGRCGECPCFEIPNCQALANGSAISLINELTEENDRLSTALAEYEHKTNIRISEEYVHNEAYEELREKNKKLIEESENYKKIAEYQQSSNMNRGFKIKRLNEEIERLKAIPEQLHKEMSERMIEERKIERKLAVKKMQEELKKAFNFGHTILEKSICDIINQIAKEMLEGEDERE